jgi:hypothetical protein
LTKTKRKIPRAFFKLKLRHQQIRKNHGLLYHIPPSRSWRIIFFKKSSFFLKKKWHKIAIAAVLPSRSVFGSLSCIRRCVLTACNSNIHWSARGFLGANPWAFAMAAADVLEGEGRRTVEAAAQVNPLSGV